MLKLVQLRQFWRAVADTLYPRYCLICSASINSISYEGACGACLEKISVNNSPLCNKCGFPLANVNKAGVTSCGKCRDKLYHFDRALSVSEYSGITKKCIQLFKYRRKLKIGENLARIMLDFLKAHCSIEEIDLVTAVPLHRTKFKERGFNQAELFADFIRLNLNLPASFNNLKRVRNTISQYQLPLEKRQSNIKDAFACDDSSFFANKSVLIVDDIFTTGATLNECSRVLKNAGAKKVITLTMAR